MNYDNNFRPASRNIMLPTKAQSSERETKEKSHDHEGNRQESIIVNFAF